MPRIFLAIALMLSCMQAFAADVPITVTGAWVRASLGQTPTSAGYLIIENHGKQDDKLVGISAPSVGMAHLHESTMKNGVMQMKPVNDLTVKAGQSLEMKPGGMHIMLMGLKTPLKAGDKMKLELQFEHAGRILVDADVKGVGAAP